MYRLALRRGDDYRRRGALVTKPRPEREIIALIVSKVAKGSLPDVRVSRVWAGRGTTRPCYGCDEAIAANEIEVEVELAGAVALRLHQRCFRIWQAALAKVERGIGSAEAPS
jgi:hypothetical protein